MDDAATYIQADLTWEAFQQDIMARLLAMDTPCLLYQDGRLLAVNAAFYQRFKFSESADPAEINEALWRDSGDRAAFERDVTACQAGKKVESVEYRVFRGNGDAARARVHFLPFSFVDHDPVCACGITDDAVTAHILELMENCGDDVFQLIAENSLNGIALVDNRFRLVYMNPAGLEIYGFRDLDQAKSVPIISTVVPEDMSKIIARAERWMKGEPNDPHFTHKIARCDGEIRDLDVLTTNIYRQGVIYRLNTFIDITERLQAEESLRESEERLRAQYKGIPVPTYTWRRQDDDFILVEFNDEADAITGGRMKEFLGMKASRMYAERPDILGDLKRGFDERITINGEYDYDYRTTGQTRRIAAKVVPVSADLVLIHTEDVTDRRRAEEALKRSEERFRIGAQCASDLIYEYDVKSGLLDWFGDVDALFGYGPGEFPRTLEGFNRTIHPDDRERVFAAVRDSLTSGKPYDLEYRVRKKGGEYIHLSSRATVLLDPRGKLLRWIGAVTDITQHKQAEQALLESEHKYRLLAENVTDVIWTVDREGRLTYLSPSIYALSGYQPEELIGQVPVQFLPPALAQEVRIAFKQAMAGSGDGPRDSGEESFTSQMRFPRKGGDPVWTEVKWSFLNDEHGRRIGILGVARDIEKRKQAELALEETERRLRLALREEVRHARGSDHLEFRGADATFDQYPSPAMRLMLEEARVAAQSNGNLLLLGKSGAGKNFLAGWIHQQSPRTEGPFLTINCSAIPASLIESELFGHEAGAFTGSRGTRRGLLELAEGGTLFLDEIGDMDLMLQTRLLQFLDTRAIRRVGGNKSIAVDSRIIAATNHDLESLVREGSFREDLYYRLNVLAIRVPPLSERREDLPVLAGEIIRRLARDMGLSKPPILGPEVLKALTRYDWPGNVRELKNILERMLLTAEDKTIINDPSLIPSPSDRAALSPLGPDLRTVTQAAAGLEPLPDDNTPLKSAQSDMIKKLIKDALARAGSQKEAAQMLGISRYALYRYMAKLNIKARKTHIVRDK